MKHTIYVDALHGNDLGSGQKDAPYQSAAAAFDAVRTILAKKDPADITLRFAAGVYPVTETLSLCGDEIAAEEYSLTLSGEKGAELRGTYDIPAKLFKKVEGKEYYAYTLPRELYSDGHPPKSKAVYFNGETRDRAATDYTDTDYNEELFVDENGQEYYSVFVKESLLSDLLGAPRGEDGKPSLLCSPRMDLSIVLSWYFTVARITGIDYAHSFGSEAEGCHPGYIALRLADPDGDYFRRTPTYVGRIGDGKHRRFTLCNNLAFLHKAGQYYYDEETGTVYYYPKDSDDMKDGVIGLGIATRLLNFEQMKNLTVEGLVLCNTTSKVADEGLFSGQAGVDRYHHDKKWCNEAAISGIALKNTEIRDCEIRDCYYHGISVLGEVENFSVLGCRFKNIGGSSISLAHLITGNLHPLKNLRFENNCSENSAYVFQNCCGFFVTKVNGAKILHNSVIDSGYTAISVGWEWGHMDCMPEDPECNLKNVEIAYNYIENPMIYCYDGGAIYANGGSVSIERCSELNNEMHHNYAYCGTPHAGREKCMETSTSLYHDGGATHWYTHDNVVWADEETLTRWSYISLQAGDTTCAARVLCENNYILNIKDPDLTCGKGRVVTTHYVREKHSVMLYKGDCPQDFKPLPDGMAKEINEIVRGAGAPDCENGALIDLDGYLHKIVGEKVRYNLTSYTDDLHENIYEQYDYVEKWFCFPFADIRRIGRKHADELTEFEADIYTQALSRATKLSISSIDTTVGLGEPIFYSEQQKLKNAIYLAHKASCEHIRIYGGRVPEGDDPALYLEEAEKRLRSYVALAEEGCVDLWLSVKRGTVTDTAERAVQMVERIGSPRLRIAFNPAEIARAGKDADDAFRTVRPHLICLEVTDVDENGMSVPVGGGILPYRAWLTQLLKEEKYSGYITLAAGFGVVGGKKTMKVAGHDLPLTGSPRHRTNSAYLGLYNLLREIGCPIVGPKD